VATQRHKGDVPAPALCIRDDIDHETYTIKSATANFLASKMTAGNSPVEPFTNPSSYSTSF
jgi:hypothetical protein